MSRLLFTQSNMDNGASGSFDVDVANILYFNEVSGQSQLTHLSERDGHKINTFVEETQANTEASEALLFQITLEDGSTPLVNANRIGISGADDMDLVEFKYDVDGATDYKKQTSMTTKEFKDALNTSLGTTLYDVDSLAANDIVLASGEGDVTAAFVSGKVIELYGTVTQADGIFSVVSSAFGGGQTTITVIETIDPTTATVGTVILKN